MKNLKEKADLICRVTDLLRGEYKQSAYIKVILPMTVLRRLDCILEPTKQKVLNYLSKADSLKESGKDIALNIMKSGGTRIGIVFNGSPLFNGAIESGESNIRKWIIENDWMEAVIALPDQLIEK